MPAAAVVVFTCNHCPYALAWHDRIAAAARDYADRGVRFLAINSNDAEPLPARLLRGDAASGSPRRTGRFPTCTTRARRSRTRYGAKITPDVFVIDAEGRLRYRGAPDADYSDPQNAAWLRGSARRGAERQRAREPENRAGGLHIKWKG